MNLKLKFLIISNTISLFAGHLLVPIFAIFVSNVGGGLKTAGLLVSTQFFTSFLFSFIVINFKDSKNLNIKLLKLNFLIRSCAWLVIVMFPLLPVIFVSQILIGISDAIGSPAFSALISENLDSKKHIREWGIWDLSKNPAIAIASALGGFVTFYFGFQILFLFMSLCGIIAFIFMHFFYNNDETN